MTTFPPSFGKRQEPGLGHENLFQENPYDPEKIAVQLDAFSEKFKLPNLRDRLRIGFNEVAILAFEKTNRLVKAMVNKLGDSPEDARRMYADLVDLCVDFQKSGAWEYVQELQDPKAPEVKAWFMLMAAETMGYERERDLNPLEFVADVKRIEANLKKAEENPEVFFTHAYDHMVKKSEEAIRFGEEDTEKRVPIGEGFASFLPMAIKGYEAGVVQDAEGWLFVGARGEIDDDRITSVGLKKVVGPDDRNPNRQVTYYVNDKDQRVIKKIHPGLLVVLSRSFDLATSIVKALNEKKEVIDVADDALGHIRVIQTTEKAREELGMDDDRMPKGYLRIPNVRGATNRPATTREMSRPREDFYHQLHNIRAMYVYMDALKQLEKKRAEQGKSITDADRDLLSKKTWDKMEQKVDELRYVNSLIGERLDTIPSDIHSVVDMAGGAGDLGLAVTTELLSRGKEITHTEIVDPQEGVAEFMDTIIDHLPFREDLKKIAEHNTGYLQDAKITPDSMVVAKHACGTLTDDILEQWRDSKSKMLVAMTCCQGKAAEHPARYGFSQKEWEHLCVESDLTNTQVPDAPGKARERALKKLEQGNRAMKKLDMARVEYLRRHGFQASLSTTDKFPKGDVIIARRLPENFMTRLQELQEMERLEPWKFEAEMMKIDRLAAGVVSAESTSKKKAQPWMAEDYAELSSRFIAPAFEEVIPLDASPDHTTSPLAGEEDKEAKARQKKRIQDVFQDVKGRIDLYVTQYWQRDGKTGDHAARGRVIEAIRSSVLRSEAKDPQEIRKEIDAMMKG
jgi:hypothetical protein